MAVGGWDVFVSYGHEDAGWVRVLAGNLHRAGFDVFLDEWELVGGDRVTGRLEEAIRNSVNGVLVVSPHSLSRPWVREEYEALLRQAVQQPGQRRLIPVLYADAELPVFLANRLWVDFRGLGTTGPVYEARLGELVRYLQGRPAAYRPARDGAVQWPTGQGGEVVRPAGPLRAELTISAGEVSLAAGEDRVTMRPRGLQRSTADAVRELVWRRVHPDPGAGPGAGDAALREVGRRLSQDFLAGPAGAALAVRADEGTGLNEVLELGVEVADPGLADLPWEALQLPEASGEVAGVGGSPLVLHRNVAAYRLIGGLGMAPAHKVPGPLRLLVAIASPEAGETELLDYEAELARIVAAVEPARRRGEAYVRVLNEGSLDAINAALSEDPEGFHVLHLSCHARPGELLLETADGQPDPVTAEQLLEDGVPAGADLPMMVLSGCSTGLAARQERLHPDTAAGGQTSLGGQRLKQDNGQGEDEAEAEGEAVLASFAAQLVAAGVPQVLAMQAPVSDAYATALGGEFYRRLATDASPDPLLALAGARRAAERDRQALPPGSPLRGPAEWATPALTTRALRLPLFNRREPPGPVHPPLAPVLAEGVVVREVGDFVGRRGEMRQARRVLGGTKAGLVLHGIGGVGKSTLAAEVLRSLGGDAGLVVSRAGQVSVDDVLGETGARLHLAASSAEGGEGLARAALMLRAADAEWADRWRLLAEQILPAAPMIVLLDNFEDNLQEAGGGWQVRDPELAAFLAGWARRPGQSKLLFTCRYPFTLPGQAGRRLADLHLGPLSAAETRKLMWRLPGLDALPIEDKNRAYRNVGGHPRTLEYLDALLRGGQARFDDVAERMEDRLRQRGITDPAAWLARPGQDIDASLADAVTLSVDDIVLARLLDQLAATPLATDLVTGASVYRIPVDDTALVFQVGQAAERPPDPDRPARLRRVQQAIEEAAERAGSGQISLEDAGLTAEDYARYEADLAEELRPPVDAPDGLAAAVAAARAAGLLVPVPAGDQAPLHFVHRWTAAAIAALHPDDAKEAHQRAAAFWHWRVDTIPQSRQDDIDQLLEARYHHHAGGQTDQAVTATMEAVTQLQTWGQYGRTAELCRETLTWLTPDSQKAARFQGQLGILAQLRGDYDTAERSYRQVLEIFERLGDQAGMSTGYHQLGRLAELRGNYDVAEPLYRQSLEINERIGDQAGMSTGYRQLGILAQLRGDYDAAEPLYRQSLEINERIGDQASMSAGYHQLGMLAEDRGDYDGAEPLYRRSLEIKERIGDQPGIADSYHQLGILAQLRGDYDAAEPLYRRALEISERIGDQAGMARGYHQLGMLAELRGDYDAAEPLYRRALEISERIGDQAGMARGYHQLGRLAQAQGDYDAAEPLYRRALGISERIGNQAGMAAGYHQLGMLAQAQADYDAAEPLYRKSLEIDDRIGDQAGVATSYVALGDMSEAAGNLDEAVVYRVAALAIRLQIGTATGRDVQLLTGLRRELGRDRFRAAAATSGLDEESAASLMEMLDRQQEETAGN
jgi:tetratricopeptide (TPR) repeat protein